MALVNVGYSSVNVGNCEQVGIDWGGSRYTGAAEKSRAVFKGIFAVFSVIAGNFKAKFHLFILLKILLWNFRRLLRKLPTNSWGGRGLFFHTR